MTKNAEPAASTVSKRAGGLHPMNPFSAHDFSNSSCASHDFANLAFAQKAYGLASTSFPAPALQQLKLTMPLSVVQNAHLHDRLSSMSSVDALCLAQAAAQQSQLARENLLPAIDMFVLPNTSAQQNVENAQNGSKTDVVKVAYTSAEDLADALFPTTEAQQKASARMHRQDKHIRALSDHSTLVHEGLMDHTKHIRELSQHRTLVHDGLMDHTKHIRALSKHRALVHEGLIDHRNQVQNLHTQGQITNEQVKKLQTRAELAHEGLTDHKQCIERVMRDNARSMSQIGQHDSKLEEVDGTLKQFDSTLKQFAQDLQCLRSDAAKTETAVQDVAQNVCALKSAEASRAATQTATLNEVKVTMREHIRKSNAAVQDAAAKSTATAENLAQQFEKLQQNTRATDHKTQASMHEIRQSVRVHAQELDSHHSDLRRMQSAHADLQNEQARTKNEIVGLSKSLSARTQNVDMQMLAPRRPR